ncbi:MAG: hypothetical protein LC624_06800 [Halobacteriales archaeon]|nr:hypothetical protein [Halobacteriales archaeon]
MRPASWLAFAVSLAGSVLLAGAHDLLTPPLVPLRELPQREGQEVRIEATVARSTALALGGQLAQLSDGTGHAAAWLRASDPLAGARLLVRGIVERDRVGMQVRAVAIDVLRPPTVPIPAEELVRVAPALSGQPVEASGELRARTGGLALAGGDASIPVLGLQAWQSDGLLGIEVRVRAVVQYDAPHARYVLEASEVQPR